MSRRVKAAALFYLELKMAETWTTIIAGATFMVFWTATVLGGGMWLSGKFGELESRLMKVFVAHEKDDNRRFERIYQILMHRQLLNQPEMPEAIFSDHDNGG